VKEAALGKLPVGSLVLAVLRTIADMKQKEVETASAAVSGSVSYYERRQEPPPEVLADFVSGMDYPSYMIRRARDFVEEARASLGSARSLTPEEVVHRELEERAWAGFRDLQGRLDEITEAWLEHREAPYLWRRLGRHNAKARLAMVRKGRDFWSPGLCVLVCEKSVATAAHDSRKAEELAHLAVEIARRVPGAEARRARLEGLAQAVVGNALRVRSQLLLADAAFARSTELWSQGAGTFHELLDPSRPLDLEASLRLSQRRLPEAFELLERALPLARSSRARGRILLLRAKVLEEKGEPGEALACLDQAETHVLEAGEPYHLFVLRLNRLVNLTDLGHVGEASYRLPEVKALAKNLQSAPSLARCRWLEARVAAAFGQKEEAIAASREVLDVFVACESPYDCALIHLELARLLLEERRTGEVRALVAQMEPIFVAQGVHREAVAALRLFVDAARQERASVEMAQSVLDFLRRSRYNAEVHFEAGFCAPFPEKLGSGPEKGAGA
jgi:tetratricopeptide (TPR) repeat protein